MATELVKIGEVVEGRYKIIRPIADGGMGTVFLAEHWLIKRRVAIKILHGELASDATMIRRFMNEAVAAGTLGHPNIVESTDMGFTKADIPYIVFEYLEGTVLADEILRHGGIPCARALKIAIQIASALEAAHDADIVHRDLKTDNIFLIEKGDIKDHVKVLDFGISRFLTATDKTGLGGSLLGTPEFMAPEQVVTPETVDHRADIYALGVALYEMLMGRVPFAMERKAPQHNAHGRLAIDVEAAHRLLDRIINDPPPPLDCPDAPAGLGELLATKLLAKDRTHRLQSMKDVREALMELAGAKPSTSTRGRTRLVDPEIAELSEQTVSRHSLSADELRREVQQLGKRWSLVGPGLVLEVTDPEMRKLGSIVAMVAAIADEMDHQPRISIEPPRLRLTIANAGTVHDLVFAARIEQWLREHGW